MHCGDGLERNDISYVLIILHVLQAPAVRRDRDVSVP